MIRYEGSRDRKKVSRDGNRIRERWIDQNTSESIHSATPRTSWDGGLQLCYHSAGYVSKTLIDHERRSSSRRQRVRQHSGRINVHGMCNKARHNVHGQPIVSISQQPVVQTYVHRQTCSLLTPRNVQSRHYVLSSSSAP